MITPTVTVTETPPFSFQLHGFETTGIFVYSLAAPESFAASASTAPAGSAIIKIGMRVVAINAMPMHQKDMVAVNNQLEAASLGGAAVTFEFRFDPVGYAAYIHEVAASPHDPLESAWSFAGGEAQDDRTDAEATAAGATASPGDAAATLQTTGTEVSASHGIVGWVLWYLSQGASPPTYLAIKTEAIEVWGTAEFEEHKNTIKETLVGWHPPSVKATQIGASNRPVVPIKQPLPWIPMNQLHSDKVFVIRVGP